MVTARTESDIFTAAKIGAVAVAVLAAVAAAAVGSPRFAGGIIAGTAIAVINFGWLQGIMARAVSLPSRRAARFAGFRYLLRLAVIAGILYLLIVHANISIGGLFVGLSALVASLITVTGHFLIANGGR